MNDLFCCESASTTEHRALVDTTLLNDARVLRNLLKTEERYTLQSANFLNAQKEVLPGMRRIVTEWMMEVCEDQKCQGEVFTLAVNLMDRFLATCSIRKNQLQLLGTACMQIASKLREPKPLLADILVFYTDNSITRKELSSWESLVLSKLKWDIAAVTPLDFLGHLTRRIPIEPSQYELVNSHAQTLISLWAREYEFSSHPASMIASACLASALLGLGWTRSGRTVDGLLTLLHDITFIEQDYLRTCLQKVECMVCANNDAMVEEDVHHRPDEFTPPPTTSDKFVVHETAGTPTDVRDVHF